ncbi:hypothetical protein J7E88_16650 [Streptomyces sp. ISL-10]|uniref:hypothetical protein n=1 Tax=Streptomyces sp. ISL-10 TaxID=2819172 RepID=UPI001BE8968A|nr:hypothetical protein [Streptomyces sp. ISL-10]MBT2366894.1 hypothetical protein [Streptomyces sp. ISL-10]
MPGHETTRDEYLQAAREMADAGRHTLVRLLAEEAAERTADPAAAACIRSAFPGLSLRSED